MRRVAMTAFLLSGCFEEAPLPDGDDGIAIDGDSSSSEGSSEGESSSTGDAIEPYGPCETNEDCPIVPGDNGDVSSEARCFEGTCSYDCDGDFNSAAMCPGLAGWDGDPVLNPYGCIDGWCTITADPETFANCPDGMEKSCPGASPAVCVWEPAC